MTSRRNTVSNFADFVSRCRDAARHSTQRATMAMASLATQHAAGNSLRYAFEASMADAVKAEAEAIVFIKFANWAKRASTETENGDPATPTCPAMSFDHFAKEEAREQLVRDTQRMIQDCVRTSRSTSQISNLLGTTAFEGQRAANKSVARLLGLSDASEILGF